MPFHEAVAVQRQTLHTCSWGCECALLLWVEKRKKEALEAFFWTSFDMADMGGETQVARRASNKRAHLSWITALTVKLTWEFSVSAKNGIRCNPGWQRQTSHSLVFVPWALHSPCASLYLVMIPKLLSTNELPLKSKVRGGLRCAKPFQYQRCGPLRARPTGGQTCYLFANVHMVYEPFHPSAGKADLYAQIPEGPSLTLALILCCDRDWLISLCD